MLEWTNPNGKKTSKSKRDLETHLRRDIIGSSTERSGRGAILEQKTSTCLAIYNINIINYIILM